MAAYTGLYVFDVYDAVQGGDPSIPDNPFNLSVYTYSYNGTDYRRCEFPVNQNNKIIRYTLTRKADGMTLAGLTKLATYGGYGDWVGISINGETVPPDSGTFYREFATTDLTEIAVRLSNYGDPIAFWLPGATLVLDEPPPVQRRWQDWQGVVEEIGPFT